MFKKSDNKGDRTPKPAAKEDAAKAATADLITPAAAKIDTPAADAPANDAQTS